MSPPALIIVVGTTMIVGAFVLFGKKKDTRKDEPPVPSPITPTGAESGEKGFVYRGYYIGVQPQGTVPVRGFNSSWTWNAYNSDKFDVAPLASGSADVETNALRSAMKWIDDFRS